LANGLTDVRSGHPNLLHYYLNRTCYLLIYLLSYGLYFSNYVTRYV